MEKPNSDLRERLIGTAKEYAAKILAPFDRNIKINVYISGSVSYGFCDGLSDIEMEFYFPTGSDPKIISQVDEAIKACPAFLDVRMSAGISEWPLEKILCGNIEAFWKGFNPYTLYELMAGLIIREDVPLLEKVKEKIPFYPKKVADMVVKGLWLTAIDSGYYDADYSLQRNELFVSHLFFFRAMEALMRLAYIANQQYYPHTKWLARGLSTLPQDFGLGDFVKNFETLAMRERIARFNGIANSLSTYLVEKGMLESKYKHNAWDIMADKYYIFSTF